MTLILDLICPSFVVHMSDRQISLKSGPAANPRFSVGDPIANKTIVYRASDAIMVMGFAGFAYFGDRSPADQWLAERLWGKPLTLPGDHGPAAFCLGGGDRLNHGQVVSRLKLGIEESVPIGETFEMSIGGFRTKRGRAFPFHNWLKKPAGSSEVEVIRSPRFFRGVCMSAIGAKIDLDILNSDFQPMRQRVPSSLSTDDVLQVFQNAIIRESALNPTVGSNALAVVLTKFGGASLFLPRSPHFASLASATPAALPVSEPFQVAHTPWILTQGLAQAPSVSTGDQTSDLGGYTFHVRGAPRSGGSMLVSAIGSIRRPSLTDMRRGKRPSSGIRPARS